MTKQNLLARNCINTSRQLVEVGGTGASALRGAPAAKANRCLRLIASALLRDGSRGLPPLPLRYGGSIPQTKTFKTPAKAEVLNVVEVRGIEPLSDREYLLLLRVQSVLDSWPHAAHRPGYVGLKLPKISNQPK